MACRLTKLQSKLTMASLPYTTLRQSNPSISFPFFKPSSQKNLFSYHRRSIPLRRDFFPAVSNPSISFPCFKPSNLPVPINRLRISQNRFLFLAFSADTPKPEINPNPSYPIPGEPATTPEKNPETPEPLPPEVPAKPESPPSPDPSWPSEIPRVDPSTRPEISPLNPAKTYPAKTHIEVPLRTIGIRDPPLYPPGSPPPDIVPPVTPPGLPPDIPPNVPPIPPPDVPPIPSPDFPPFPCPPPPDPFPPIPTPPIMRDWYLQVPWIPILNINGFL